ncbi:hypothetical protein VP01_5122g1, partial [Puccinia sorghi]
LHEFLLTRILLGRKHNVSPEPLKFPSQDSPRYLFHSMSHPSSKDTCFSPTLHNTMDLVICNCSQCVKETTSSSTGEIILGCWNESKEVLNETESIRYIYYFIVWISVVCGVSQSHCQIARDWIINIIKIFRSPPQDQNSYSKVLYVARNVSAYTNLKMSCSPAFIANPRKLKLEVKVFSSQKMIHSYRNINLCLMPVYLAQLHLCHSFPVLFTTLKNEILSWRQTVQSAPKNKITDIQQSNAWRSFSIKAERVLSRNEMRLTFSLYIYWFNPFSSKLSGRHASMGVVALTCLDLSVGIVTAPKEGFFLSFSISFFSFLLHLRPSTQAPFPRCISSCPHQKYNLT